MPYKMSTSSIQEAMDADKQFYRKDDDTGTFEAVTLDSLHTHKAQGTADVTLETGEMKIINVDDLYA